VRGARAEGGFVKSSSPADTLRVPRLAPAFDRRGSSSKVM
jgi:hypothetical protein